VKRYSLFLSQLFPRVNVSVSKLEEKQVFMCVRQKEKNFTHEGNEEEIG